MPDGREATEIRVIASMADIGPEEWDACAGADNPTVSHAFLSALEDSGSVCAETGWQPQHLCVFDGAGKLAAAVPLYLKSHSYGEYVFDWGWADAYERAGGRYYPKLQSSVPFTPVTGPRLLLRPDAEPELLDALGAGMMQLCQRNGISSVHVTFLPEDQWQQMGTLDWLLRTGEQFHWLNDNYTTFDDFLAALSSRKRKNIKKERRKVTELGLEIRTLSGDDLTEDAWDAFYGFYCNTSERKWGEAYLAREFFSLLSARMADKVALMMAYDDGVAVAGALNIVGRKAIFGRNWGCLGEYKFLHFELCYYQAIDYAIRHGLIRVEAGAQGPHKLQRGYLPTKTYSAHWIRDPGLRDAIEHYLNGERKQIDGEIEYLGTHSPFRKPEP
jgi:uncharacterized protein